MHRREPLEATQRTINSDRMGIRSWALLGTAVAIIPLLGFAVWIVAALVANERMDADRELEQRTQAVALALKRRFDRGAAALEALAVSPGIARGEFGELYEQSRQIAAANADVVAISMVRADGSHLFSTAAPLGQPIPASPAAQFEERVFADGVIAYTPLFVGAITKRRVMAISVPVRVRGRIVYSLRMTLPTQTLSAVLKEQVLPLEWTSALVDPVGIIAGRSSESDRLVGRPVTPSLQREIASSTACPFTTSTYDGASLSSCVARVPGTNWAVAIGVPAGAYDGKLHQSLVELLIAGIASLLVGFLGAIKIANSIRGQIGMLVSSSPTARPSSRGGVVEHRIREVAEAAKRIAAYREREGALETELIHAKHDALTGLPGRKLFRELVAFDLSKFHQGESIALLFVDLDGFKAVNDSCGHEEGDRLLVSAACAIRDIIRSDEVAARLGGDEFVVYIRRPNDEIGKAAKRVAQDLIDQIAQATGLMCSVGGAVGPCDSAAMPAVLSRADHLMMQAKAKGKGRFVLDGVLDESDD